MVELKARLVRSQKRLEGMARSADRLGDMLAARGSGGNSSSRAGTPNPEPAAPMKVPLHPRLLSSTVRSRAAANAAAGAASRTRPFPSMDVTDPMRGHTFADRPLVCSRAPAASGTAAALALLVPPRLQQSQLPLAASVARDAALRTPPPRTAPSRGTPRAEPSTQTRGVPLRPPFATLEAASCGPLDATRPRTASGGAARRRLFAGAAPSDLRAALSRHQVPLGCSLRHAPHIADEDTFWRQRKDEEEASSPTSQGKDRRRMTLQLNAKSWMCRHAHGVPDPHGPYKHMEVPDGGGAKAPRHEAPGSNVDAGATPDELGWGLRIPTVWCDATLFVEACLKAGSQPFQGSGMAGK